MFGFPSVAGAMLAIGCFPLVGAFAAIGWRWPFALHLVGLLVIPVALTLPRTRSSGTKTERTAPSSRLAGRSEEHTSELQSLMRISYAVFCLKKKNSFFFSLLSFSFFFFF